MPYVHIVIALALLEFFLFGVAVARARATYRVMAPATSGHEVFERYFRVQMNTLEQLVIFVPSVLMSSGLRAERDPEPGAPRRRACRSCVALAAAGGGRRRPAEIG